MNGIPTDQPTCVYRINAEDVIEFVNDAWLRFAADNGAGHLSHRVIGTPLWDHVSGAPVVHLFKELVAKVRSRRAGATVPFRCDSPTIRRDMRMWLEPLPANRVEFRTWVEREVAYAQPQSLLDLALARDPDALLRMCAWCKKIDAEGAWRDIEDAAARLRLFARPTLPEISHGICGECHRIATAELAG